MEMKNICGKIPVELHEKVKLEVEELGISIPKYLEMVIEEHIARKGEKTNMADLRTVAVQVTEDLFSRLKAVLAKNGMKQKDFLIGLIEEALKKEEAKWKAESAEATEPEEEPSETELEEAESAESETDEESELKEAETEEEPTESEAEEPESEEPTEPTEPETEEPDETASDEADEEETDETTIISSARRKDAEPIICLCKSHDRLSAYSFE